MNAEITEFGSTDTEEIPSELAYEEGRANNETEWETDYVQGMAI